MVPHPEIRRMLNDQHIEMLRNTAASPGRGLGARQRFGALLIAAGTRLAPDAPPAARSARRLAA